jgi:hypothetical protein
VRRAAGTWPAAIIDSFARRASKAAGRAASGVS